MNTSISTLLQRAEQLVQVKRYTEAAAMLRQVLTHDPDNAFAHAFLAFCLVETKQLQDATRHAEQAVAADPELALGHLALANALRSRQRFAEARVAIDAALQLEPEDPRLHAMKAQICFNERDWRGAQAAAERGLQLDPRDETCANLRAMALRQQRQGKVAEQAIRETLARDPENSDSHANLGWTLLEQRKPKEALKHFQEALRLEPESEFAKVGLIHALQSQYVIYRWMFQYFAWISKFAKKYIWAILLGGYFGYRALLAVAENVPALRIVAVPLVIAYVVFALSSWLVTPITNLALMASRYGRSALKPFERWNSLAVAGCLAGGLCLLVLSALRPLQGGGIAENLIFPGFMLGLLALPVSGLSNCDPGWPRRTAFAIVGSLGLMVVAGLVLAVICCITPRTNVVHKYEPIEKAVARLNEIRALPVDQQESAAREFQRELEAENARVAQASWRSVDRWAYRLTVAYGWVMLPTMLALNWLGMQTVRE